MELREVMNQKVRAYILVYSCGGKVELRP